MHKVFEIEPIIVAGIIGALAYLVYTSTIETPPSTAGITENVAVGFGIGAIVQIGVRMAGVS